jgi:hypothetical protein
VLLLLSVLLTENLMLADEFWREVGLRDKLVCIAIIHHALRHIDRSLRVVLGWRHRIEIIGSSVSLGRRAIIRVELLILWGLVSGRVGLLWMLRELLLLRWLGWLVWLLLGLELGLLLLLLRLLGLVLLMWLGLRLWLLLGVEGRHLAWERLGGHVA